MPDMPLKLAVIVGSTREGRFGRVVADWFMAQLPARDDMVVDLIDLVDIPLPAVIPAQRTPEIAEFAARIDDADAFVVVTPEYNHGYPASLKQAIDLTMAEWHAKPVGFVSYGGMSGGSRAVDQLRQVFPEVHATTIRDTVTFIAGPFGGFDAAGKPVDEPNALSATKTMLDQLSWWGRALRAARAAQPYGT